MTFQKWMEAVTFIVASIILIGLLIGVGWLYKVGKINTTDAILIYILGQFVTGFWDLVKKRNRIEQPVKGLNQVEEKKGE